jgi:hypothetical protein
MSETIISISISKFLQLTSNIIEKDVNLPMLIQTSENNMTQSQLKNTQSIPIINPNNNISKNLIIFVKI